MTLNFKIFFLLKFLLLIFKSWDSKLRFILSHYSVGKKGYHTMSPDPQNVLMNILYPPITLVPANCRTSPFTCSSRSWVE